MTRPRENRSNHLSTVAPNQLSFQGVSHNNAATSSDANYDGKNDFPDRVNTDCMSKTVSELSAIRSPRGNSLSNGAVELIEKALSDNKRSTSTSASPTSSTQTNTGRASSSTTSTPLHGNFVGSIQKYVSNVQHFAPRTTGTAIVRPIPLKAENVVVVLNIKTRCRSLADVVAEREVIGGSRNPSPEDDINDLDDDEQDVDIRHLVLHNDFGVTLDKPKVTFSFPTSYLTYYEDGEVDTRSYDDESKWDDPCDDYNSTFDESVHFNNRNPVFDWKDKLYRGQEDLQTLYANPTSQVDTLSLNTEPVEANVVAGVLRPKPLRVTDLLVIAENYENFDNYFPVSVTNVDEDIAKDENSFYRIGSCINVSNQKIDDDRSSNNNTISCLGSSSSSSTISSRHSP